MTKVCKICGEEKDISFFGILKRSLDGYRNECKLCRKIESKRYYEKNKEKMKEYNKNYRDKGSKKQSDKRYYEKNKESFRIKSKLYREENKEEIRKANKIYREKNRENLSIKRKIYYERNKKILFEKQNERMRYRRKFDICFKLHKVTSKSIWYYLIESNSSKFGKTISQYLPYTMEQLKQHLESQFEPWMNWDNYGNHKNDGIKRWNIDHIIPQSKLLYDSMEHPNFQKCWALSNLRPLEALENIKKGNKIKWNSMK